MCGRRFPSAGVSLDADGPHFVAGTDPSWLISDLVRQGLKAGRPVLLIVGELSLVGLGKAQCELPVGCCRLLVLPLDAFPLGLQDPLHLLSLLPSTDLQRPLRLAG